MRMPQVADRTSGPALNARLAESLGRKKIPSLDGLRAVAVMFVILFHMNVRYVPYGRGVLTFFVLSGFLITWMLLNESEKYGNVSIRNFYVRRVLRIFPAFYLFLIVQFTVQWVQQGHPSGRVLGDYLSLFTYTSNYRFALAPGVRHPAIHSWALAIEEQFYLLWPWLFVAFRKDLRKLSYILIGMIAFADIYRVVLFFHFHAGETWMNFAFDTRIDHLLVGCLLAILLKRGVLTRFWNLLVARTWVSLISLAVAVLSMALAYKFHLPYRYGVGFAVDPLITAVLLVQAVALWDSWVWGWLNWRGVRYVGQISYAVFLYHMFARRMVLRLLPGASLWLQVPLVIAIACVFGACSYHWIEMRFLALKSKFMRRPESRAVVVPAQYEMA